MKWSEITKDNSQYIDKSFLLDGWVFGNPTRISEADLRAFWKCWYQKQESKEPFAFKRVGTGADGSDDPDINEPEINKALKKGKGVSKESEEDQTPKSLRTDEEKVAFLQSLLPRPIIIIILWSKWWLL